MVGQVVKQEQLKTNNAKITIPLASLPSGVYMLTVGNYMRKIVKE
jgi:hypothetical protein